jgi:hypothetical protein
LGPQRNRNLPGGGSKVQVQGMQPTNAGAGNSGSDRLSPVQALVQLNELLFSEVSVEHVLAEIANLSRADHRQAAQVSVTLMDGDEARTAAFTGDIARQLDEQ